MTQASDPVWLNYDWPIVPKKRGDCMEEIFGSQGLLKSVLPDYEFRPQQLELAQAIDDFLYSPSRVLAGEAPTGIGKTFAALVPALKYIDAQDGQVLVLTSGLTLQDQLMRKDLPALLSLLGLDLSCSLLKGRNNYVCIRLAQELSDQGFLSFDGDAGQASQEIARWLYETKNGELSKLSLTSNHPAVAAVASSWRTCMGNLCPHKANCFYSKAVRTAVTADVVVSNYHLYFAYHLGLGRPFPVEANILICDEAHRMASAAQSVAARTASQSEWLRLLRRIPSLKTLDTTWLTTCGLEGTNLQDKASSLRRHVESCFELLQIRVPDGKTMKRYPEDLVSLVDDLASEAMTLSARVFDLKKLLQSNFDEEQLFPWLNLFQWGQDLEEQARTLLWCCDTSPWPSWAFWREVASLKSAPVTGADLIPGVFGDVEQDLHVVALSATMTVDHSFQFWSAETGICPDVTHIVDSPFVLEDQMKIYVVDLGVAVTDQDYDRRVARVVRRYCLENGGATLVLLSSRRLLKKVGEHLKERSDDDGFEVLVQGDRPRTELLEQFRTRDDQPRVLLGLSSFWEGVDVVGDALTQVIIDRIPFPHPGDPVVETRECLEGRQFFMKVLLPEAKMRLRQAVGRLIRSRNDHGRVVLLDGRIITRPQWRVDSALPKIPIKKVQVVVQTVAPQRVL